MDSIIKTVLDGDWKGLKEYSETKASELIKRRVDDKKIDVLANLNAVSREQMEEIVNIKEDFEDIVDDGRTEDEEAAYRMLMSGADVAEVIAKFPEIDPDYIEAMRIEVGDEIQAGI